MSVMNGFPVIFQSTSPVWRTTALAIPGAPSRMISIHVPRVEDDAVPVIITGDDQLISIHVPRVEDDSAR